MEVGLGGKMTPKSVGFPGDAEERQSHFSSGRSAIRMFSLEAEQLRLDPKRRYLWIEGRADPPMSRSTFSLPTLRHVW